MTTIPNHSVDCCRNINARHGIFDELMNCGVLQGGEALVKTRLGGMQNGALLVREFDNYLNRSACATCFWKLVHESLPHNVRNKTNALDLIFYVEIVGKREELEEDACLRRLMKQKTMQISQWAYVIEDYDEAPHDCKIKLCYKTECGKRLLTQIISRIFPETAGINNKLATTTSNIMSVVMDGTCVKHGEWEALIAV